MKKRILLVEDDLVLGMEWEKFFNAESTYELDWAATSHEAEAYLSQRTYDAFLLDLFHVEGYQLMSDGGGNLIAPLRKKYQQEKPIIVITGYAKLKSNVKFPEARQVSLSLLGADYVLEKPIDPEEVLALLKKIC